MSTGAVILLFFAWYSIMKALTAIVKQNEQKPSAPQTTPLVYTPYTEIYPQYPKKPKEPLKSQDFACPLYFAVAPIVLFCILSFVGSGCTMLNAYLARLH